uniref:Uncharacterized protein n=1 Tax=Ixodes ricinus TaxID=34613 RepID=A0A6B0U8G1_IXORI
MVVVCTLVCELAPGWFSFLHYVKMTTSQLSCSLPAFTRHSWRFCVRQATREGVRKPVSRRQTGRYGKWPPFLLLTFHHLRVKP